MTKEPIQPLDQEEQSQLIAIFQAFLSLPNRSGLQLYFYADTSGGIIKTGKAVGKETTLLYWTDMQEGVEMIEAYKQELEGSEA